MKKILTILFLTSLTTSVYAQKEVQLSQEAQTTAYYLSLCADKFSTYLKQGEWVGKVTNWGDSERDYGYNFYTFTTSGFLETKRVGKFVLKARKLKQPPADGPSHEITCTYKSLR